jgi:FkbM family methyltransferase
VGIQERLEILGREYCLDQIQEINSGVVIDIGSNIGEFTLIASQRFPNCTFLRFEPSLTECQASEYNLTEINNVLIQKPLWNKVAEIPFYDSNDIGDSSIFQPNIGAKSNLRTTTTLDIEISRLGIESVELLKLEAEGAEPEILEGAEETLRITKRITADLGPERGLNQERTFLKVNQILLKAGFALKGKNPGGRECYLYTR